jgi:predicted transcriptional regulator
LPILKAPPKQAKTESLQLRVPTEFKCNLQRYADFLEASPSYVVVEALNRLFEKDREFKAWLEQQAADSQSNLASDRETNRNT